MFEEPVTQSLSETQDDACHALSENIPVDLNKHKTVLQ